MTVVVGVRGKKGVLLAADTAGTNGYGDQRERNDGKTLSLSETVAIAYSGSYRMGQLLRYHLTLPELPLGMDEHAWAVTRFIPAMRDACRTHGWLKTESGVERGGFFLVGVRHRLFRVESDFQVGEDDYPWTCDGSGGEAAAGHFRSVLGESVTPVADEKLLPLARAAVVTACDLNAYCRGKVTHVRTKRYTAAEKKLAQDVLAA